MPESELLGLLEDSTGDFLDSFPVRFAKILAEVGKATDLASLQVALVTGSRSAAVSAFDWTILDQRLVAALTDFTRGTGRDLFGAAQGGSGLADQLAARAGITLDAARTDRLMESVASSLEDAGRGLAKDLTVETQNGIKAAVRSAFELNQTLPELTAKIQSALSARQVNDLVGLTEAQTESLAGRISKWMREPGITGRELQARIDRAHANLVDQRANVIARTEANRAFNYSLDARWADGAIHGELDPREWEAEWVARPFGACPRCQAFDGKRRSIASPSATFISDTGERASRPEIHPHGFCTMRLVRVAVVKAFYRAEMVALDFQGRKAA